jgi:hypothetical protein
MQMMRKKISWLFLLTVLLTLFSCRNDVFPEQDLNSNNSSKFQLTSKRISLSQSKHKVKLLPELEKAKHGFEAKNTAGKVVHYGNGVSINTDDVVYIEYGPYHTYTFQINRDNASVDAPVENLILSLEPDGTYKELIKTYNLMQNEWQELSLGNGIDLHGKTITVEVAKGTYNQALTKVAGSGCYYESQQVYQACCHGVHGEGNIGDWGNCTCTGAGLPKMYTIEILVCNPEPGAPTSGWTPTPSSPTAPTAGGEPLNGGNSSGSQNNPTDPNTVEGAQEELGGTPTLPNLGGNPQTQTPCEKIKDWFSNTKFIEKYNELNKPENFDLDHEKAFIMRYPPVGTNIPPSYFQVDMPPCSTGNEDTVMPSSAAGLVGLMHTHTNLDCNGNYPVKVPSPVDIKYLLNTLLSQANQYTGSYSNAYSITITSGGSYMLVYTGTNYPGSLNYDTVKQLKIDYKIIYDKLMRDDKFTQPNIEKEFVKFMKEKINKPGLEVYRVTPTSAVKLEYDPNSSNSIKQTPCP